MPRFKIFVLAVATLAVLGFGAALLFIDRPPPSLDLTACRFRPIPGAELSCLTECGDRFPGFPPFAKEDAGRSDGHTWHYCCPRGTDLDDKFEKCIITTQQHALSTNFPSRSLAPPRRM